MWGAIPRSVFAVWYAGVSMELDAAQRRTFFEDGYVVLRGAVAPVQVHNALRAINHSLGHTGLPPDELPRMRAASYCDEVRQTPPLTDLANRSPVFPLLESMLGAGNLEPMDRAQVALRFPTWDQAPPSDPTKLGGHMDGVGTGTNGIAVGDFVRNFTVLAVVYLQRVAGPWGGNFTVWPGSHRVYEAYFKDHPPGHSSDSIPPADQLGFPHPPVQLTGEPGDVVLAHHQIHHGAAPNHGHDVRYAAIFRAKHVDAAKNDTDTMADIWREFPGVRAAVQGD